MIEILKTNNERGSKIMFIPPLPDMGKFFEALF